MYQKRRYRELRSKTKERKKTIFQTSLESIKIKKKTVFRSTNVSSLQQMQISFPFNYNSDNLINVTLVLLLQSVGLICTEIKIILVENCPVNIVGLKLYFII
jgi:hypothetical protein